MSLLRRWFDPIRSSWFYQKPSRQAVLPTEQGLTIYLRLDCLLSPSPSPRDLSTSRMPSSSWIKK